MQSVLRLVTGAWESCAHAREEGNEYDVTIAALSLIGQS